MNNRKWYVVWVGHTPGVYASWAECLEQIHEYPKAKYKSFPSEAEAQRAYADGPYAVSKTPGGVELSGKSSSKAIQESLSVDASCSGNPGKMEYRGVYTKTHAEVFHMGPFPKGTNNIGEFLAIVHALALLKKMNKPDFPIYSDSVTAMSWIRNKHCKTLLPRVSATERLFEFVERAEKWLHENPITNPIYKWKTEVWGEIPADFGRK